jgi:hypothetical protein
MRNLCFHHLYQSHEIYLLDSKSPQLLACPDSLAIELFKQLRLQLIMSTKDNENERVSLTDEILPEAATEEPIEQVTSQETTDTIQPSERAIESEDQERFEETAKFEEEVEHEPSVSKLSTIRKEMGKPELELISNLQGKLRKHLDASKKTDVTIKDIQKHLRELNKKADTKHHQIVKDLQTHIKELQRKFDTIDRSIKSKPKKSSKKTPSSNEKNNRNKSKKKSGKR